MTAPGKDTAPDVSETRDHEAPLELTEDQIELRAKPRPVTRINRRMLGIAVGAGGLVLFGIAMIALDPPSFTDGGEATQLYNTDNTQRPEGLEALPEDYAGLPPSGPEIPELGPPLPGDLGEPILEAQQAGEFPSQYPPASSAPPPIDPIEEARRAERLRLMQLANQARESGVFFSLGNDASGPARNGNSPFNIGTSSVGSPGGAFASPQPAGGVGIDRNADPNFQSAKRDFVGQEVDTAIYNPHSLQEPISPYQVMAGTIIPASLLTGINSDLPGQVIAQVTSPVYDTPTGEHLLIPQGTRVIGRYDSVVAFGQERALVIWTRLIMPDGSSILIDNLPATDAAGYAGLEDEVDFHSWRLIRGIGLSTLLGVGTELTFGGDEGDLVEAIRESAQRDVNRAGQRITERNLDIQPTITVRPGWPVNILVAKDLVLRPYGEER